MSASGPLPDQASGSMCLLERVLAWDAAHIHCLATSHTGAGHPLAHAGTLGMANGIEYAAQAMAVHGALLAGSETAPAAGFLTCRTPLGRCAHHPLRLSPRSGGPHGTERARQRHAQRLNPLPEPR
jgi:predicted hotdog family 3-hydroxylacyl-ACP dehydratase